MEKFPVNVEKEVPMEEFRKLRDRVHLEMDHAFKERLIKNPNPTEDELHMAAFIEWLEPQVKDAIVTMFKKGYASKSSGFYGNNNEFQAIDGYFVIDNDTKKKINSGKSEWSDKDYEIIQDDLGVQFKHGYQHAFIHFLWEIFGYPTPLSLGLKVLNNSQIETRPDENPSIVQLMLRNIYGI